MGKVKLNLVSGASIEKPLIDSEMPCANLYEKNSFKMPTNLDNLYD